MTWDSQIDCGTTDYMSISYKKDCSNHYECICVFINKFQIEFASSQHTNNKRSFMTEFEMKVGKTNRYLSFQLKHIYQFVNIQLILDNRMHQTLVFIQSLKMDQYPFRPWDRNWVPKRYSIVQTTTGLILLL